MQIYNQSDCLTDRFVSSQSKNNHRRKKKFFKRFVILTTFVCVCVLNISSVFFCLARGP